MLRIGLTGGIATGKSYVRAAWQERGVPTVDADQLARDAVAPGTSGLAAIAARFGAGVVDVQGRLDRAALASLVFADPRARRGLEAIVHPRVYAAIEGWLDSVAEAGSSPLAVADVPLLFETGHAGGFDLVVVTACAPDEQVRRLRQRDGLSQEAARQRLAAQWPIDEKARLADYVIRTDGSFAETDAQAAAVLEALFARASRT